MLLITGFEPFGGDEDNPSADVIARLRPRPDMSTAILPVVYAEVDASLAQLINSVQPSAIMMFGLSESTAGIRLEQVALNLDDSHGPDNAGEIRCRRRIHEDGPVAYRSTLPLDRFEKISRRAGIPVEWSRDAGAFLCNHAFYHARHHLSDVPGGFVHMGRMTSVEELTDLAESLIDELTASIGAARS